MPETLEDFLMTRPPTADRPLLGQTILVVEDSRYACDALRLICQRSGARIRRADSLRSAKRHLRSYRPGIALVDVGLPDGSGLELIRLLADADPPRPITIAISGDSGFANAAIDAGAQAFMEKPITSISEFQSRLLAELPKSARPRGLRTISTDEVVPDRIALRDDLSLAAELVASKPDQQTLEYIVTFLTGVAKSSKDAKLEEVVSELAATSAATRPAVLTMLRNLLGDRLKSKLPV